MADEMPPRGRTVRTWGLWPGYALPLLYVPADGDSLEFYPGKIWYVRGPKDWVDVLAGTADG